MKKFKLKAIAVALLASMTVSAAILPSKAAKIGEGLTLPEDGVVRYDFDTTENPLKTNATEVTANGESGVDFDGNKVFKIGYGANNIYVPKNWETDYLKKSMSVRFNNSGMTNNNDNGYQRILLWYGDENNWLGVEWKINTNANTYDVRAVAKNGELTNSSSGTEPASSMKWLTESGRLKVAENDGWMVLTAEFTAKNKVTISMYKESDPDTKYTTSIDNLGFVQLYDMATGEKVAMDNYLAKYDWRYGMVGIAGTGPSNANIGYYDDLTVTMDVDSAAVLNFRNDNAEVLALTADGLYNSFKTNYSEYTAELAKVKAAYQQFEALSDNAKSLLSSELDVLKDLLFVEKEADAYMGKDINIDFEDGLSADKYMNLTTAFTGGTGGQKQLAIINNPSSVGNSSSKVLQLANDGWSTSSGYVMKHLFNLTENQQNLFNTVSFKTYIENNANSWHGLNLYYYFKDENNYKYIKVISEGGYYKVENSMRFDGYTNNASSSSEGVITSRSDFYYMNGETSEKFASTIPGWITINVRYAAEGILVSITDCNGITSIERNVTSDFIGNGNIYKIQDGGNDRYYETKAIAEKKNVPENYLKDSSGNEIGGGINDGHRLAFGTNKFTRNTAIDDLKITFRTPYDITMTEGAWLRNTAKSGMRFGAQEITSNELYNKNDCTVVASGALFMPENGLEDGELLTVERTKTANSKNYKARGSEKTETALPENVYGVLTNVIDNASFKADQKLVCRVYIKYTKAGDPAGTYRYAYASSNSVSRSLSDIVISAAKQHADYTGSDYTEALTALKNAGYLAGGNQ